MSELIWDPLASALLSVLFGSTTRAGISLGILGPIAAFFVASLGAGVWLAILVWVASGLAAGALLAVGRRGRDGLLTALAVPIGWLAIVGSLAAGSFVANRGPLDAVVGLVELVALVVVPSAAGYGVGRWANSRYGSAQRKIKPARRWVRSAGRR